MLTLRIPSSGRLLTTHLAAYGLALVLHADGHDVSIGHDPDALECDPVLTVDVTPATVAGSIIRSAHACESAVEADLTPHQTGNNRLPVIRARATDPERAVIALEMRERLLDQAEAADEFLVTGLLAGLGAPAPWLHDGSAARKPTPGRGATQLDGVPYNIGSDIVRGFLRRARNATQESDCDMLARLFSTTGPSELHVERDLSRWSPDGSKLPTVCQWLAGVGLGALPVGLTADGRAHTPGFWREPGHRGLSLPVLAWPISIARLRAILLRPELTAANQTDAAARLRALGVSDVISFSVVDVSSGTMVAFSFRTASRRTL